MIKKAIFYLFLLISESIFCQNANLGISSTNTNPTQVGHNEVFTLQVINNGPDIAENVTCSINNGSCFNFISAETTLGNYSNNVWTIGNLANGQSAFITITNLLTSYCNCSYEIYSVVTSTTNDPYVPNNNTSVNYNWDTQTDIGLQCVPFTENYSVGETVNLTFNLVNNDGNDTCASVYFGGINGLTVTNGITTNGTWNNESKSWNSILSLTGQTNSITLECVVTENQNVSITANAICSSLWEFITENNNCTMVLNNLSTSENQLQNNFSLFPNPAYDIVNITNKNKNITSIQIVDALGKKVLDVNDNSNQLNISNLISGLYFVKIKTEDNLIYYQKLIKE